MSEQLVNTSAIKVGVDDGHDGIKLWFGSANAVSEPVKVQIKSNAQRGDGGVVDVSQEQLNQMTIIVEGRGGDADEVFLVDADYVTNRIDTRTPDYPYNNLNLALIMQAIREQRNVLDGFNQLQIIAGLPANQYYTKSANSKNDELINKKVKNLQSIGRAYSPADAGLKDNGRFYANDVAVMPEGYGIAFNLMFDDELNKTEYYDDFYDHGCVIVDIGGRTVDVIKVARRTCKPKGSDLMSFDQGVLYMREVVATQVTESLGRQKVIDDFSVDNILKSGWFGKVGSKSAVDLTEMLDRIKDDHVEVIYQSIKSALESDEALGGVIISGGGAVLLGDKLKAKIEEHNHNCDVIIPDEVVFGNAKGFWKLAWAKFQ